MLYVPSAGFVRFAFADRRASGFVRSPSGAMFRVAPGSQLFLSAGRHVLTLYAQTVTRVSIAFRPC